MVIKQLIILTSLCLCACGKTELENEWQKYPDRIANLTASEFTPVEPPNYYPVNQNQYRQAIEPIEINLIKALSIQDCQLQNFIGERNSSLGKVHSPSNRLIYEKKLLDALNFCSELTQSAEAALLTKIKTHKQNNWPKQVNNYLIEAEPVQAFYQQTHTLLENDTAGFNTSLEFINALTPLITPDSTKPLTQPQFNRFENSVAQIYNRKFISQLFYTLEYTQNQLAQVNKMLTSQAQKQVCTDSFTPVEITYLHNVFIKYYAHILQPHLTKLNSISSQIAPKIDYLFAHSQIQRSPFGQRYLTNQPQSVYYSFNQSIQKHTQLWQQIFKQCGLMPK
ncbi:DUF3080 domain-containing protein [Catenovulum sp. 2E275]|uniref:DUF3080 domain-containing protein n=1 Tax=Catenovulum sp. 2E275 TaxID=2980497 RepID=UPI0021D1BA5F|nr:DUF3080 domain-containing protein [Catenovulum sp. 2E275]MCU4676821.1 DUF3080 domain-containing protein [Catenovulum sp. 2E275]